MITGVAGVDRYRPEMNRYRQIARTAIAISTDSDKPNPTGDDAYALGALTAFHQLVFQTFAPVEQAAQAVYEATADLGFQGRLTFGYSADNSEKTQEGEHFTGPFMRVRTRTGELHVLRIGVDPKLIEWIDGSA